MCVFINMLFVPWFVVFEVFLCY